MKDNLKLVMIKLYVNVVGEYSLSYRGIFHFPSSTHVLMQWNSRRAWPIIFQKKVIQHESYQNRPTRTFLLPVNPHSRAFQYWTEMTSCQPKELSSVHWTRVRFLLSWGSVVLLFNNCVQIHALFSYNWITSSWQNSLHIYNIYLRAIISFYPYRA